MRGEGVWHIPRNTQGHCEGVGQANEQQPAPAPYLIRGRVLCLECAHLPSPNVLHRRRMLTSVHARACRFVASSDKRLQRLRPFAHSPVVWFRHPYAHVLLVSWGKGGKGRAGPPCRKAV